MEFWRRKNFNSAESEHRYLHEGKYKVTTLTVTNDAGSGTEIETNYIKVTTNTRLCINSENK